MHANTLPQEVRRNRENRVYNIIATAATGGRRAPTNAELCYEVPGAVEALKALISKGVIERRWYGKNWRVFIIRKGPEEGRRTNMPPSHYKETIASKRARGADD